MSQMSWIPPCKQSAGTPERRALDGGSPSKGQPSRAPAARKAPSALSFWQGQAGAQKTAAPAPPPLEEAALSPSPQGADVSEAAAVPVSPSPVGEEAAPVTPPMTPRPGSPANCASPGAGAAAAAVADDSASAKKGRRVSFLDVCLGADAADDGDDWFNEGSDGEAGEDDDSDQPAITTFAMNDSDDEGEEDEDDDMYDFDPEKLAKLLEAGASREELSQMIEEVMAKAAERRLKQEKAEEENVEVQPDRHNPYAGPSLQAGCDESGFFDVSGQMTPGRMTPTEEAAAAGAAPGADDIAQRMQQAVACAKARAHGRRSSVVRKEAIKEAMAAAIQRRRRSVAGAASAQAKIEEAKGSALRRHRLSVARAAEVLEVAGVDGSSGQKDVDDRLQLVQKAMEDARRRHRRSIVEAVQQVEAGAGGAGAWAAEGATDQGQPSVQDRIRQAVAAAYERRCNDETRTAWTPASAWQSTPSWEPAAAAPQFPASWQQDGQAAAGTWQEGLPCNPNTEWGQPGCYGEPACAGQGGYQGYPAADEWGQGSSWDGGSAQWGGQCEGAAQWNQQQWGQSEGYWTEQCQGASQWGGADAAWNGQDATWCQAPQSQFAYMGARLGSA